MNAPASSGTSSTVVADAVFMDRALELAACGVALTSPNPMVGAVLVRDGKIIGEGFHTYEGVRHAEVVAVDASDKPLCEKAGGIVGRGFRHDIKAAIPSGVLTPEAASEAARGAT